MPVRSIAVSVPSKTEELRLKGDVTSINHRAAAQTKTQTELDFISTIGVSFLEFLVLMGLC